MQVVGLVTARSGSKSVIDKNIREIEGRTLIEWSVRAALASSEIAEVYISTDSQIYADIAEKSGAIVPFLRPSELATDVATDAEVFSHFISSMGLKQQFSGIVHLRPTSPLRDPQVLDQAVSSYVKNRSSISALRSVHEMPESAYKSFELDESGFLKPLASVENMDLANMPRQSFPLTYAANGYVDIVDADRFMQSGSLHGDNVLAFITPQITEIDSERELELLKYETLATPAIFDRIFGGG